MVNEFEPSGARGRALDLRMRERLADSLDYVLVEAGTSLGVAPDVAARITSGIRLRRQSPQVFGAYYDLVLALERDDLDQARALASQLDQAPASAQTTMAGIDDRPAFGVERYRRLFIDDPALVGAPDDALFAGYRDRLDQAFALLDAGFPEMADEIRALLREIVVAAGPEDPKARTFDGASCYMLWGAVLLNARGQDNVLDAAQALAHESGHNLLFGFCSDGPLVDNPDDELFHSPLRRDPRPMDGVVHATYVIARMHQTLARLLEADVLDARQTAAARTDLALHQSNFFAGDSVVRSGGRLTAVGVRAMESARAYMRRAAERRVA